MKEVWKEVSGYPRTEVSTFGNVRTKIVSTMQTYKKVVDGYGIPATPIVNGYKRVHLHHDGKLRRVHVHRLVAETFIDRSSSDLVVNHKDNDRLNNCVSNLEWVSQRENVHHYYDNHYDGYMKRLPMKEAMLAAEGL